MDDAEAGGVCCGRWIDRWMMRRLVGNERHGLNPTPFEHFDPRGVYISFKSSPTWGRNCPIGTGFAARRSTAYSQPTAWSRISIWIERLSKIDSNKKVFSAAYSKYLGESNGVLP